MDTLPPTPQSCLLRGQRNGADQNEGDEWEQACVMSDAAPVWRRRHSSTQYRCSPGHPGAVLYFCVALSKSKFFVLYVQPSQARAW